MNIIEQLAPGIGFSSTLFYVYENVVSQELEAIIKPINGVIIGAVLLLTVQKMIELAIDKFGSDRLKSSRKLTSWLITPILAIGMLASNGVIIIVSDVATGVLWISMSLIFFTMYYLNKNPPKPILVKSEFTFASIAGMKKVKDKLTEAFITPIKNKELSTKYGLSYPKGVIFYGQPGCGKTHLAHALAGELNLPFIKITAGDIASRFMHGTTELIKQSFSQAIEASPCVLFMDEFDGIAFARSDLNSPMGPSHTESITELITQIDNAINAGVIVIAATNNFQSLDPAIIRNGRFDTKIQINLPDQDSREKIFEFYLKNLPTNEVNYEDLAKKTKGFSCSDIKSIVEAAAKRALSQTLQTQATNSLPITMSILLELVTPNFSSYRPPQKI